MIELNWVKLIIIVLISVGFGMRVSLFIFYYQFTRDDRPHRKDKK